LKGNVRLKEKQQNLQKRQQQGWQWRGNVQLKQEERNLVVVDFSTLCCMLRASTFGGVLGSQKKIEKLAIATWPHIDSIADF